MIPVNRITAHIPPLPTETKIKRPPEWSHIKEWNDFTNKQMSEKSVFSVSFQNTCTKLPLYVRSSWFGVVFFGILVTSLNIKVFGGHGSSNHFLAMLLINTIQVFGSSFFINANFTQSLVQWQVPSTKSNRL